MYLVKWGSGNVPSSIFPQFSPDVKEVQRIPWDRPCIASRRYVIIECVWLSLGSRVMIMSVHYRGSRVDIPKLKSRWRIPVSIRINHINKNQDGKPSKQELADFPRNPCTCLYQEKTPCYINCRHCSSRWRKKQKKPYASNQKQWALS